MPDSPSVLRRSFQWHHWLAAAVVTVLFNVAQRARFCDWLEPRGQLKAEPVGTFGVVIDRAPAAE